MKKRFLAVMATLFAAILCGQTAFCQDWPNLERYREANESLLQQPAPKDRVVFMGNSITDNWFKFHPEFFNENNFEGRGISGQTTPQMLVRFRQDVVALSPKYVVILAGTNDIAGNTGYSSLEMIMDNLKSMCDIAKANKIKPILCSVLPAYRYSWKKSVRPDELIPQLNELIEAYAKANRITYVDFFTPLVDNSPENRNGLPKKYSPDGVHPNMEGYAIMEKIILDVLK